MKNRIIIFFFFILTVAALRAAEVNAVQFLKTAASSRVYATASSLIGPTDSADIIFYNPAGMFSRAGTSLCLNYTRSFQDINNLLLAGVYRKMHWGNLGLGIQTFFYGKIKQTDINGLLDTARINSGSFQITAAYHKNLFKYFNLGLAFKAFNEKLTATDNNPGFAVDLGCSCSLGGLHLLTKNLYGHIVVRNLGIESGWGSQRHSLPLTLQTAVTYKLKIFLHHWFDFGLGLLKRKNQQPVFNTGLTYTLFKNIFFRLGYISGQNKTGFRAGL
ncbi:MAG TPA: hypothetical protein VKS21_05870, partial [Spirochaetota bacterium]|nr:hypothetical protein [Spirochaetota bacterium]